MGTRFEIVLPRDNEDAAAHARLRAAGEAALEDIQEWHRRLSRFEPDSFVSHINRTAWHEPVRLDDQMFALMADALQVWRDSDGAFDVNLGGTGRVVLDDRGRTIQPSGGSLSLDFGAIGKGHALDCAAALLRQHGIRHAFLHGGTSSGVAIGRGPDGSTWRVVLGSEDGPAVDLWGTAFSVSDTHSQVDDTGAGHIIDPRGAITRRRVAVIGPSARLADAWSTALAVLGAVPPAFPQAYTARWLA
jgi:thiamine biosynthesis lipoprotein